MSWLILVILAAIAAALYASRRQTRLAEAGLDSQQAADLWRRGRALRSARLVMLAGMVVLIYVFPLAGLILVPLQAIATHKYADRLYAELQLPEAFRRRMRAAQVLLAAGLGVAFVSVVAFGLAAPATEGGGA